MPRCMVSYYRYFFLYFLIQPANVVIAIRYECIHEHNYCIIIISSSRDSHPNSYE